MSIVENSKTLVLMLIVCALFVTACAPPVTEVGVSAPQQEQVLPEPLPPPEPIKNQDQSGQSKNLIPESKLLGGGPPKDGIPSIDTPQFMTVKEADKWIQDDELVMVIVHKGVKRVYPHSIMVWHEIVNDNIAGDPIAITYCPLCGSTIAFKRELGGEEVEFGTSGKLFNSNLVMYDRKTESLWTQVKGQAVIGKLAGETLTPISLDFVKWGTWKKHHPDSEVLKQDTINPRPYERDPYGDYYWLNRIMFPVEHEDKRVHGKTVVHGIEVNGEQKAYQEVDLKNGPIEDIVGGVQVKVEQLEDGRVVVTNLDTGKEIVKERDFWFCWFAFHPSSELYVPT